MTCLQLDLLVSGTYIYQLLQLTGYSTFFRLFTRYELFRTALLLVSLLTLGTLLIRGGRRIKFSELEKSMSKEGGKGGKSLEDD